MKLLASSAKALADFSLLPVCKPYVFFGNSGSGLRQDFSVSVIFSHDLQWAGSSTVVINVFLETVDLGKEGISNSALVVADMPPW